MARQSRLTYIPNSINFSEFPGENFNIEDSLSVEDDLTEALREELILKMLKDLRTDRDRVVLLLQIMRGDGYDFDHNKIADLLEVHVRWYFRILEKVKKDIKQAQESEISHSEQISG